MTNKDPGGRGLDHAWRYFQLHAAQRMTVFNVFTLFAGLLIAGLSATIQKSEGLALIGIALGLLLTLLAFVFWKLDQRACFLVKLAEDAIADVEDASLPSAARMLRNEQVALAKAHPAFGIWTHKRSFGLIFLVMGLVGATGTLFSALRYQGMIHWPSDRGEISDKGPATAVK